jgi:hypothetical protein
MTERLSLKFRADMFDAFNHVNLANPNASIADVRDGGTPNPNAGQIFGTQNIGTTGSSNRTIQFGLTLTY